MLSGAALSTYLDTDAEYRSDYMGDLGDRVLAATGVDFALGDVLEDKFNGKYGAISVEAWKDSIEVYQVYTNQLPSFIDVSGMQEIINGFGDKIKKYDASYVTPSLSKFSSSSSTTEASSSGCYVATAVYGSYDCPEVWTLRRFRDYTLDETWYGRLFIKTYYAISPTFVKYFGNVKVFKVQGKKILDRWVAKLNSKGFDNTPYKDKY